MTAQELAPLTTEQFETSVAELAPRIAVFDCDGTLWSGDAGSTFMRWTMQTGLLSAERTAWLQERYDRYNRGEVNEFQICGEMVQVYAGIPESTLRRAAALFFAEQVKLNIFPELERVIARLRAQQVEIWAVSSTSNWVIEAAVVEHFGIPASHVLGACVEVTDGLATEHIRDIPTDAGKVASLARMGIHQPDAVFGNSVHDAAMLAIARRAYPVNPTPALVERSRAEGWPVFYPESVAPLASGQRPMGT